MKPYPLDLQSPGCPVCNCVRAAAFDHLAQLQGELARNPKTQADFANEHGLCPIHTWELHSVSSPDGLSRGYAGLAELLAEELSQLEHARLNDRKLLAQCLPPDQQRCRVCILLEKTEKICIADLVELMAAPEGRESYNRSEGVCIRHLHRLVSAGLPPNTVRFLLDKASSELEKCARDMRSYVEKRATLRRDFVTKAEKAALSRAVTHIVGEKHVT